VWRIDIDSFTFPPVDHKGLCVLHRGAFETLAHDCVVDCVIAYARDLGHAPLGHRCDSSGHSAVTYSLSALYEHDHYQG
jgi:hypothetical protein